MCGLSGVVKSSHLTASEKRAFIDLGMLSFIRGTDSTGLAVVTRKKSNSPKVGYDIVKDVDHPLDFFKSPDVTKMIFDPRAVLLMGHARAATHGTVNATNAQPMRSGGIVGTHNGVVRSLAPTKQEEDTHTDSRKLFETLEKRSLVDTLSGLNDNDSYALAFVDLQYQTMNFIRNKDRPLFVCRAKSGALFWSSEAHMIVFALARNDIEYEDVDPVPVGVHLSVDLRTGKGTAKDLGVKTKVTVRAASSYNDNAFGYTPRSYPNGHTHLTTNTSVPIVPRAKVVPAGWLLTDSQAAYSSHHSMIKFMSETREHYERKNNVVPLVTRETMGPSLPGGTADTNLRLMSAKEAKEAIDARAAERIAEIMRATLDQATEDKESNSFLKRPSIGDTATYVDLDTVEYRMRKNGIPVWVSGKVAESHLRNGCGGCHSKCSISDTVYWKRPTEYLCDECYHDENMKDFYRIDHSEYVESDLILDSRRSVYS